MARLRKGNPSVESRCRGGGSSLSAWDTVFDTSFRTLVPDSNVHRCNHVRSRNAIRRAWGVAADAGRRAFRHFPQQVRAAEES